MGSAIGSLTCRRRRLASYVSGHSTFSAASAEVLRLFTGSDSFGGTVTIEAGTVGIEPAWCRRSRSC